MGKKKLCHGRTICNLLLHFLVGFKLLYLLLIYVLPFQILAFTVTMQWIFLGRSAVQNWSWCAVFCRLSLSVSCDTDMKSNTTAAFRTHG
jgi:hypothetical protein